MSCEGNPNPLWVALKIAISKGYGTPFLRETITLRIAELERPRNEPPCKLEQLKTELIITFELASGFNLKDLPL